jgi:hypothetical protein
MPIKPLEIFRRRKKIRQPIGLGSLVTVISANDLSYKWFGVVIELPKKNNNNICTVFGPSYIWQKKKNSPMFEPIISDSSFENHVFFKSNLICVAK